MEESLTDRAPGTFELLELEEASCTALLSLQISRRGFADGVLRLLSLVFAVSVGLFAVLFVKGQQSSPSSLREEWADLNAMYLQHDAFLTDQTRREADIRPTSRAEATAFRSVPFSSPNHL
jgi:hypothetical protein